MDTIRRCSRLELSTKEGKAKVRERNSKQLNCKMVVQFLQMHGHLHHGKQCEPSDLILFHCRDKASPLCVLFCRFLNGLMRVKLKLHFASISDLACLKYLVFLL